MTALLHNHSVLRKLAFLVIIFCVALVLHFSVDRSTYVPEVSERSREELRAPHEKGYMQAPPELVSWQSKSNVVENTPRSRLTSEMQEYLKWSPPPETGNHYPPYDQYATRDYDPNRWESFPENDEIYVNDASRKLRIGNTTATPYRPYPDYHGEEYLTLWEARFEYCKSPRNLLYNESDGDTLKAYRSIPAEFPAPDVGSFEAVGLDDGVCFDRLSRLGPYLESNVSHMGVTNSDDQIQPKLDFSKADWGDLQDDCLRRNTARFKDGRHANLRPGKDMPESVGSSDVYQEHRLTSKNKRFRHRTAVLVRTWDAYEYHDSDLQNIRSLISELSLQSGGEYQVFLFVHVKDLSIPIHTSDEAYEWALSAYVPPEFHSIAVLWSESVCQEWYPAVGEWSVYWQQFMPIQWFAKTFPQFDFFWNWEIDTRYIGQHYHLTETIARFAQKQPRRYLWERNSRFYIPAVHGTWDEFVNDTNWIVQTSPHVQSIWGAQPWSMHRQTPAPIGPGPPWSEFEDDFKWGVGEEADLITLLPIWDPRETFWSYRDKLFNYPTSPAVAPSGDEEGRAYPHIPRRVFINTHARLSRRLLDAMHATNLAGQSMASEIFPASIALHHGLKAVYAPHPIWTAQKWPPRYMDAVFNADGWGAGSLPGSGNMDTGRGAGYIPNSTPAMTTRPRRQPPRSRLQSDPSHAGRLSDQNHKVTGTGTGTGTGTKPGTGPNNEGKLGRWSQERDAVYSPDREHNFGGWSWYFWSDFPKTLYRQWLGWPARSGGDGGGDVGVDADAGSGDIVGEGDKAWDDVHGRLCLPGMLLHPVKNVRPVE